MKNISNMRDSYLLMQASEEIKPIYFSYFSEDVMGVPYEEFDFQSVEEYVIKTRNEFMSNVFKYGLYFVKPGSEIRFKKIQTRNRLIRYLKQLDNWDCSQEFYVEDLDLIISLNYFDDLMVGIKSFNNKSLSYVTEHCVNSKLLLMPSRFSKEYNFEEYSICTIYDDVSKYILKFEWELETIWILDKKVTSLVSLDGLSIPTSFSSEELFDMCACIDLNVDERVYFKSICKNGVVCIKHNLLEMTYFLYEVISPDM